MKVTVDLQRACDLDVPDEALFQAWSEAALKNVDEPCEVSIRLVGEEESAELNNQYRNKTGPTNVLSFPFESPIEMTPRLLGDLVICVPVVVLESQQQSKPVMAHWAHMVVHGCLHLLGYDHVEDDEAEVMEALEVNILQVLDITNPYEQQAE